MTQHDAAKNSATSLASAGSARIAASSPATAATSPMSLWTACCMSRFCRRSIRRRGSYRSTRPRRWRCPASIMCLTGEELAAGTEPLMNGLDTPNVRRFPLAVGQVALCRRMGRGRRRGKPRPGRRRGRTGPCRIRAAAVRDRSRAGATTRRARRCIPTHGTQRAARQDFRLGRGRQAFRREPAAPVVPRDLGPQLDGADRDLWRCGQMGSVARNARCLGLDPDAEISRPDRARLAHSGQQRPRASGCRCRRQLWRQARHQADRHSSRIWRACSAVRCG